MDSGTMLLSCAVVVSLLLAKRLVSFNSSFFHFFYCVYASFS